MARKKRNNSISNPVDVKSASFFKGMNKDINENLLPEGSYINARNAINSSIEGDIGIIENEQSNLFCTKAPYTIIGTIHLYADKWAIFSTDNTNSEIGIFEEDTCNYRTVVNDPCLNFNKENLIIGEAIERYNCSYWVYWSDGLNPDRRMDLDNPPFKENCITVNDCLECTLTTELDCEKLRLAPLIDPPCLKLLSSKSGGEILNGSYQAFIAYTENGQRVTDYSTPSNVISTFDHRNVNAGLELIIENLDTRYDQFELVIAGFVNSKFVARRIGTYSTRTNNVRIDRIDPELPSIPIELLTVDIPAYESSKGIYKVNNYLLRVAPKTRYEINYQPLANQIETYWVTVEYKADYYRHKNFNDEGLNTQYLRDEVYSFFIRFIYNTGDKTPMYHIPGRAPLPGETNLVSSPIYGSEYYFEANNTAAITSLSSYTLPDGGRVIRKGKMAYWESSEKYPDDKPDVWGNLCGKNIRHHKMPDEAKTLDIYYSTTDKIRILGVQFENIQYPVDSSGNPIPGIVGYEILRGKREGNKTIVAKGIINNMGSYIRNDNGEEALYQNYPYNDLRSDPLLSQIRITGDSTLPPSQQLGGHRFYKNTYFTFHSPDTQFKHPFLSAKELRIYKNIYGTVKGRWVPVDGHPKDKIITNATLGIAIIVGLGLAFKKLIVKRDVELGADGSASWANPVAPGIGVPFAAGATLTITGIQTGVSSNPLSINGLPAALAIGSLSASSTGGGWYRYRSDIQTESGFFGTVGMIAGLISTFTMFFPEGVDQTIKLIKNMGEWKQYAIAFRSHGFYNSGNITPNGFRSQVNEAAYLTNRMQTFTGVTINNLWRPEAVILKTSTIPNPPVTDTSRNIFSNYGSTSQDLNKEYAIGICSSHYVGLKQRIRNLYGQIDSIASVPISCPLPIKFNQTTSTPVLFGGDTYIGRYTEKNTFFYFYEWLYNLPNGTEFDYTQYELVGHPTYWVNFTNYDFNSFMNGLASGVTSAISDAISGLTGGVNDGGNSDNPNYDNSTPADGNSVASSGIFPSNYHNLDKASSDSLFIVKDRFFYLFYSGIRDFFVESEVNVEFRDWGDKSDDSERHYDPYGYTAYWELFKTPIIKAPNYYKYDFSLSISRYYNVFDKAFGVHQNINSYDPNLAETCYVQYPNRIIYSLPYERTSLFDRWSVYLVNNFKDFTSRPINIKSINKTGAIIFFETESPRQFLGVDTLQTDSGTKLILGDGGLFAQPPQRIVNADSPMEYGSCQNRLSVINTPAGLFWISQNQGKVFNYQGGVSDITSAGMKWWFKYYLPYKLLKDFPDYDLTDNPVIGISCQSIYDTSNDLVYFTKRDFKLKDEYKGQVFYIGNNRFRYKAAILELGDERFFEDASWTISYDPKSKAWISFHDWHPNLLMPSKYTFLSVKNNSIWKHNIRTDSFCNFYGVDYPFEVETAIPTGQQVNTLKSIEYQMEAYKYFDNNKFHVLDFNFSRAVIYNSEQISGYLNLKLTPKNNAPELVTYPRIYPNYIEILYSKEEHKYRFNQFWDIVDDRGEFTTAERPLWIIEPNGYKKSINNLAVNYNKPLHERKKFRHYNNFLLLIKEVSGAHNIQLKLINHKNQYSAR